MYVTARNMFFAVVLLGALGRAEAVSVSLTASTPSPAKVGDMIHWSAAASGAQAPVWYRFRVRENGGLFHIVKDFGPGNTLDWTAAEHEGTYDIEVSARNAGTPQTARATESFQFLPRVGPGGAPAITPTSNPLVFLYSTPECGAGQRMRVQIRSSAGERQSTPYRDCTPGQTMNFYLAGLRPQADYTVRYSLQTESGVEMGPDVAVSTSGGVPKLPALTASPAPDSSASDGVLLQASIQSQQFATDLNGNVIWYYSSPISYITRPEPGGRFLGVVLNVNADASRQILREFDLAGMTLLETNAARINEQLAAAGKRPITGFHHEARRLPGGNILVLAGVEQILTDVQGAGPIDILGDMILVLDRQLQVVWTWDTFDHLDVTRKSVTRDTCPGGCAPLYLAKEANDWVHGNAVELTPDGNLLYSARAQDWIIKIDYQNGSGSGDVIWRLGDGGDFIVDSMDAHPWFSHQHDPQILPDGRLLVFDNGNIRNVDNPAANSRGQVYLLDEEHRLAGFSLNADLGVYSYALGSAQLLPNGNFHFLAGWLPDGGSADLEVSPVGEIVSRLHSSGAVYRSFRMKSMYTP